MGGSVLVAILAVLMVLVISMLVHWRKAARKRAQNQEQIDRKVKEEALDRALSNNRRRERPAQAQTPITVHYNSNLQQEDGSMIRLTEQAESMTKEYLFRRTEVFFLGEEYGRSAIFREREGHKTFCELFPYQDGVYVRNTGKAESRIIRGKNTAALTEKSVRLHTGDKLETQAGVFLVELI